MAVSLPKNSVKWSCYNCTFNGWEQEEDTSLIQCCAKCKVVKYCSKQCQKEHWFNVHKKQCKYLARLKVYPQSVHDEATCQDCKVEAETGWVEMSRPDNPVLGCVLENIKFSNAFHFSLGEISGEFLTKTEATLSLMLRILFKMKDTRHTAWVIDTKSSLEMCQKICVTRGECWKEGNVYGNPGHKLNRSVIRRSMRGNIEIGHLVMKIEQKLENFIEKSKFRPWDTLKLLQTFLRLSVHELNRNMTEHAGLPEMPEELLKIRLTSAQFNAVWQQILDTLNGRLVPYTTLVEVMCGGNLKQACWGCLKEVTVDEFTIPKLLIASSQCPVLMFRNVWVVLCDGPMCAEEVKEEISAYESDLEALYMRKGLFEVHVGACICDYCGLPGSSGNMGRRCSRCLTKVYCGEECRDGDWVVHKMVCREEEEERKRKGGQLARKMKGRDGAKKYFAELKEKI